MHRRAKHGPAIVAVGLLGVAVLMTALSASAAPMQRGETIAIIPAVAANPAQQAIVKGFNNQARLQGLKPVTLGGEFDPQAQITAVNAAIQRRVAVLAIWPLDPKSLRPTLDRARRQGIRVLTMWTPARIGQVADFQYAETPAARKVAGLAAAEVKRQGKTCKVGIIQGLPIVPILKARNDALEAGAKAAGCQVVEKQVNEKDSADGALPIVQAWRTKWGSEMTAVLAYNDPSALGAVAARGGSFQPVITGMNADPAALQAIKKDEMLATTTIPNPEMGNAMAYAAALLLNKKSVPRKLLGSVDVVTKANATKYVTWDTRNKKPMKVRFVKRGSSWFWKTTPDYGIR